VTISGNQIYAAGSGTAELTGSTDFNTRHTWKLTVNVPVKSDSVTVYSDAFGPSHTGTELHIIEGETIQLSCRISPGNTEKARVIWQIVENDGDDIFSWKKTDSKVI
jgi:hypothetical protein